MALPESEADLREGVGQAMVRRNYEYAALCSLRLADLIAARSAIGAQVYMAQAQTFALLEQSRMALFIAEERQPMHPGGY